MKNKIFLGFSLITLAAFGIFNAVSCSEKDIFVPELKFNTNSLIFDSHFVGSDSVSISSNTNWTASSSESWLSLSPTSGTNDGTLYITAQTNTDTSSRTALITVTAEGLDAQSITVKQNRALSVSASAIYIGAEENSTATFTIKSEASWTVNCSAEWLNISPKTGSNDGSITLTALHNADTARRTASILVMTNNDTLQTIEAIQNGSIYTLEVSKTTLAIGVEGGDETFTLSSNTNWTITNPQPWLSINPTSGSNDATININIEAASTSKNRVAVLNITAPLTDSKSVRVTQEGIPCAPDDDNYYCNESACPIPAMPTYLSLPANEFLPDPFTFFDGTPVTSKADFTCRQVEISALAQEFEYGYKPCTPYSATTAKLNGNILTITVDGNGKSISFNCTISYPNTGSAPYPAMIGMNYSFLNNTELLNMGVAIINFPSDEIAQQVDGSSRGKGKFYDFFCADHSAGAIMAWSWGISRLIDALEKTPEANINANRLGVTGCSRNGKGALAAGAFDTRIALTIPQESGSGGAASWRVSDFQGSSVQRLSQIVTENVWFRKNFSQFSSSATKLPFDHHMIAALCAPRALLFVENTSMTWLGNLSTWTTGNAAHMVWEALGVPDNMGFTQVGHSDHCGLPAAQQPEVAVYVKKFLLDIESENTSIMKTDGNLFFDAEKWINWTVPDLE
ncbi:MAG: BACON domain-containing protein [Salinivirgaceae bacterium]